MSDVTPEPVKNDRQSTEPPVEENTDEELHFVEPAAADDVEPHPAEDTDSASVHNVEPAPLVEPAVRREPVVPMTSEEVPAEVSEREPVLATEDPAAVEFAPVPAVAPSQTVYVAAPNPPRKQGNRGIGILLALAATVVFGVLFAVAVALIRAVRTGVFSFTFVGSQTFYVPVLFFLVGFVVLVLIANRASWWAYILGSLFVGAFVYFGTVGTLLLTGGALSQTPDQAAAAYNELLTDPYIITAALLAREVAVWMGTGISARGRRVKQRNADAREAYERESANRNTGFDFAGNREASY
ncbi:hypothetical protein [Glaciihabitans sp. UYNi722]|uniref:hypothetical protein n=1 Tax=Glaciihabitans sp. UYNi722 TaxID=3156344 RepID=UPI0033994419